MVCPSRTLMNYSFLAVLLLCGTFADLPSADDNPPIAQRLKPQGSLKLKLRTRVESFKGSGAWDEVTVTREVPVAEAAIIICDMWDKHWCDGATARCDALADKIALVVQAARAKGIQIIHAP